MDLDESQWGESWWGKSEWGEGQWGENQWCESQRQIRWCAGEWQSPPAVNDENQWDESLRHIRWCVGEWQSPPAVDDALAVAHAESWDSWLAERDQAADCNQRVAMVTP